MDVTDALRRIVVRHLVLIAIATVISVAAFAGYKATQPATYSATAQVEVADRASTSAQMATSVADTATAYTKANDTVTAALKTAHVTHDVNDFIANDLTVGPVLTAPDIDITVKYTNKQQAVNIAQALAQATTDYFAKQAVSGAQQDKDAMTAQLADVTKQYNDAATAAGKWNGVGTNVNQTLAQGLLQRMDDLTKQINADSQKIAETYRPSIVDQARIVPATTLSKAQPYILVFFVGLILGVGLAAVLESISPSVVGAAGLAGLFGAPFLGYAAGRGGIAKGKGKGKNRVTDLALAARLHAAARRVGADTVVVAGDVRCDLPGLAERLDTLLGGATGNPGGTVSAQAVESGSEPASAPAATDAKALKALKAVKTGESGSKELATRQESKAPALYSERLSFGEDIPAVWVHPRVVPYDEQVLLLLSTAPVSVAVAVVGAPKGKRRDLNPAIELVETSGWEVLGTILADPTRKKA